MGPTGQTVTMFLRGKAEERDKEWVHMYECPCVLVAYVWRACQRQCVVPGWGWSSAQWSTLSPPTASPTVTLGQWCWQWLVTMSCTPPSSLHPSHLLLLCSTFIWPHLLPLAFNAELGSPLIKVKASLCLTGTEREEERRDREGETDRKIKRKGKRVWKTVMKEWKTSLPL